MPLRFGIVPLEFEPAVERIIGEDGLPDFSRFNMVNISREAVEKGYKVIEIQMQIADMIPGALTPKSIQKLVELKDELGHAYTVHLPLWSIEPASFTEPVRRASVECIVDAIKLAEPLEPEAYVLHSTGPLAAEFSRLDYPKKMKAIINGYMASFSAKSVGEIVSKSDIDSKKLAVENIEFPFEITRTIVDEFDTGICFDTGHLLTRWSGNESCLEFYNKHKDRIIEFHLQDGIYEERDGCVVHADHVALGRGGMNIRELLTEVVKDDFKGPVIFELTADEARESLEKIREVVPEALD
jgi:sugar phosphate isomerase/epimerase